MRKHWPNILTAMNVLCGSIAIIYAQQANFTVVFILLLLASVFDFFDGFVARLLGVNGEYGKIFDSLADMVTFGVVPALVLSEMMELSLTRDINIFNFVVNDNLIIYYPYTAYLIIVFSALRLAKFHVDKRQVSEFIGLATPANALLIVSLAYLFTRADMLEFSRYFINNETLLVLCIVLCFLLVSEIPMFSLKFKGLRWAENQYRYIFIAISIPILYFFKENSVAVILIIYILLNLVRIASKLIR